MMKFMFLVKIVLMLLFLSFTANAETLTIGGVTYNHTIATLSQARYGLSATSIDGRAFFAGGDIVGGLSNVVDSYDVNTGTWLSSRRGEVSPLSQSRYMTSATSSDGRAFFAGGAPGGPYESKVVDVFDSTGSRIAQTSLYGTSTSGRQNMATASANGKVYFAGGGSHYDADWTEFTTDWVDEFDATTLSHRVMTLSTPRSGLMGTSVNQTVLFGGGNYIPLGGNFSVSKSRVDIYNTQSGIWSTSELSVARQHGTATTVGDKAIFAGGQITEADGHTTHNSSVVDIFDSLTGLWSTSNLSQARYGLSAGSIGDLAFFAGGTPTSGTVSDVVDVYDQRSGTWSVLNLSAPRSYLSATTVGNTILFGGGYTYENGTFKVSDVVDVFTVTPTVVPEPISSILFVTGGTLLAGRRFIRRKV